tara:strand:+ start:3419 stop:3619 length:201 start_codon:yes stop_codon:yes gene_type:complete
MKQIKITISPIGEPTIDAVGFTGGACKKATQPILTALADKDVEMEETNKPELHMMEQEDETETLYN